MTRPRMVKAGNPWRPPPSISEWITPTVHGIAQAIYDERWAELPILADALEDAGCPATVECERCEVETVGQGGRAALSLAGVSVTIGSSKTQRIYLPDCRHCHGTGRIPHPLLAHLRDGGVHARGCWGLDCILRRE